MRHDVPVLRKVDDARVAVPAGVVAVVAGDLKSARSLAVGTDAEFAVWKSTSELLQASKRLRAAATKRFGEFPPQFDPRQAIEGYESSAATVAGLMIFWRVTRILLTESADFVVSGVYILRRRFWKRTTIRHDGSPNRPLD